MLALRLRSVVSSAIDAIIFVTLLIFCADSLVCFVWRPISLISSCSCLLLSISSFIICAILSSASRMAAALSSRSFISFAVCSIFLPIPFTFLYAVSDIPACCKALCVILFTAISTSCIDWFVSVVVLSSSSDALSTAFVLSDIASILLTSSFLSCSIALYKSPVSSCCFISFVSISIPKLPVATCCTAVIPFFTEVVIEFENTITANIQHAITMHTVIIIILTILSTTASLSALLAPTNTIPTGFSAPLWNTGI